MRVPPCCLVWIAAAGCAFAPAGGRETEPPAPLRLCWQQSASGGAATAWSASSPTFELQLFDDGSCLLRERPPVGTAIEVRCQADAARRAAARRLLTALRELPRWSYCASSTEPWQLRVEVGGREVHRSWRGVEAALGDFLTGVADTAPPLTRALDDLRAAPRVDAAGWWFSPEDDVVVLGRVLVDRGHEVQLRYLATRIIAEGLPPAGLTELESWAGRFRAAYVAALQQDGRGDYFLALVLLRLGDPIGVPRIVDVALTPAASPGGVRLAAEARAELRARFGAEVVPEWDGRGVDPGPAAARRFMAWFEGARARLVFEADAARYRVAGPPR